MQTVEVITRAKKMSSGAFSAASKRITKSVFKKPQFYHRMLTRYQVSIQIELLESQCHTNLTPPLSQPSSSPCIV